MARVPVAPSNFKTADGSTRDDLRRLAQGFQELLTYLSSQIDAAGPPSGAAGGQLGGTYPNPDVRGLRETSGPTELSVGAIADGQYLYRSGSTVLGSGVPKNPFLDPPSSPHADNDEFTDVALTGWTVRNMSDAVNLTRSGDIDPWTNPTSPDFRSSLVGGVLFLQVPVSKTVLIYKAITPAAPMVWTCRAGVRAPGHQAGVQNSNSLLSMFCTSDTAGLPTTTDGVSVGVSNNGQLGYRWGMGSGSLIPTPEDGGNARSHVLPDVWLMRKDTGAYWTGVAHSSGGLSFTPFIGSLASNNPPINNTLTVAYVGFRLVGGSPANGWLGHQLWALDFIRRSDLATAWAGNMDA